MASDEESPFPTGGGSIGALIRSRDWSDSPLGAPSQWSSSLRSAVELLLPAQAQIVLFWGAEFVALYNDAYAPTIGNKHPRALGRPAQENWAELWEDLHPLLQRVRDTGETVHARDRPFYIERHGYGEEVYFDISYSPVCEKSSVAGVLCIVSETTSRVLAERALRAERDRQHRLLNYSPGFVLTMRGPEHIVEFVNESHRELFGSESWLGRPIREILPELQQRELFDQLDRVFLTGEQFRAQALPVTHRFRGREETHVLDFVYAPVVGMDGAIEGVFCQGRDVTARVEVEARLRRALEVAQLGTFEWNLTTDAVQLDDRSRAIFGFDRSEGTTAEEVFGRIHPDDVARVRDVASDSIVALTRLEIAYRLLMPDGGVRYIESLSDALAGADGKAERMVGVFADATKRATAEQALRQSEERLRELNDSLAALVEAAIAERNRTWNVYRAYFENTAESLFVVGIREDGGFTVEDLNPAHQNRLGFRLADVRGKRLEEFLPADLAELVAVHYRHVLNTGAVYQYRETFPVNGESTHWDTVLVPVRNEKGRIVRIIGSSRDLTRQLAAEEQLRQAQKMEAIGQLTGGIAHDFNNLLTPIVGVLDTLHRRRIGSERDQKLISAAAQSAERARTLVQRLLAFARRQPLQPIAVDVARLVREMGELVASTTGPQIKVVLDAPEDLAPAKADPNQLEMALLNLAVNARDAMPDGGTLRITAALDAIVDGTGLGLAPGRYVRLSVADTGIGMNETTAARAIEPFFSTKGLGKGTGLGLSMVHGLVSQLGGALRIRSKLGLGTNVDVWLPESRERPPSREDGEQSSPVAIKGRVLLIDDEALVRMSIADMLVELGYEVIETQTAEEGLQMLDCLGQLDLIVTDHLMPGMSGSDFARHIRAHRPELSVLIISGFADVEAIAPDLPRLSKPFRRDELAGAIAALAANA